MSSKFDLALTFSQTIPILRHYYDFKSTVGSTKINLFGYIPIDDPSATGGGAKFINDELRGTTYTTNHIDYQNFVKIYGTHGKPPDLVVTVTNSR